MDHFDITYLWLLAGVALVVSEALGASGLGLLFAGLGAIITGSAIYAGWIAQGDPVAQWVVFFAASAVCTALLWAPLKKMRQTKQGGYSNIIGDTAYVGSSGLHGHKGGEVTWSGTIMKAQLAKGSGVESLDAGTPVTIVDVSGATLLVKPKH